MWKGKLLITAYIQMNGRGRTWHVQTATFAYLSWWVRWLIATLCNAQIRCKRYKQGRTYRDSLLACSGRDWCKPPSALTRRGTRSTPEVSVRGGSAGLASATLCSRWRAAAPCGARPGACRPGSEESSRSCWAGRDNLRLFPAPP